MTTIERHRWCIRCKSRFALKGGVYCDRCENDILHQDNPPMLTPAPPQDLRDRLAEMIAREVCGVEKLADLYADKHAAQADRWQKHDCNFPFQHDVVGCADAILKEFPQLGAKP